MDAILTTVPWSGLGWGGLIFAAVLALIRGDLVPRRTHEQIAALLQQRADREARNADRAMAALASLAHEHGTTADKVLQALPVVTDEGGSRADETA